MKMIDWPPKAGYNPRRVMARILTISSNEIIHSRSDLKKPSLRQSVGAAVVTPQFLYPLLDFSLGNWVQRWIRNITTALDMMCQ